MKGVRRVLRPLSLKAKKCRSTMQKTVLESLKGKYVKNQLEPYGLEKKSKIGFSPFLKGPKIVNYG